ncbi:MAG: RNA polymerase subunit sigma-70 [Bacteroidetes bacterium]|nr:MAG: RNA polymerase subunit sigma-70 [Bacteroidota bacterium]
MISENDLVKGCQRGKAKSQRLLYELYAPKMLGVCMRYFHTKDEAQDALHDGFVKIYSKIKDFRGEGSFEGWIRRIMVNTSLNLYRHNLKRMYHADVDDERVQIADSSMSFDQFNVQDIMKLIQGLPDGYRIIFNMYEIDGYAHKEIAEALQISVNTSKSQLLKARKHLRQGLEELNKERNKI